MGSPKKDDAPNLSKSGSVPNTKNRRNSQHSPQSERSKRRRQNNRKDGAKKSVNKKRTKIMSPQQTDSQLRIEVDDGTKEEDEEPEFHRTTTWKSDAHIRRAALQSAHTKSSLRYDEALPVQNKRMTELMGVLGDIEAKTEDKKKRAKLEKGASLLGEELRAVEQDTMIQVLDDTFKVRKELEIKRTLQMVMDDDNDDEEVSLNKDVMDNDSNDSSEQDHDSKAAIDYLSPSPEVREQLMKMNYSEQEILAATQKVVDKDDNDAMLDHIENHRNSL